ncbi:hypothetical protein HYH03_002063 [Edaphochlamys debaryana]|uniref:ABC1 atypical kinase-like domain-containing protein n=1 Tax=Edaphochlamys debaryana TaxID=47281 RepID=A0A836C443_9CHLO|nr:hypothetical protein HYH03_002063 [Edaphochlamys debaryana]|eukprot:KAG2499766.1 hypothetical protein HYH03_002063 [Edaphochlamys debaryana]
MAPSSSRPGSPALGPSPIVAECEEAEAGPALDIVDAPTPPSSHSRPERLAVLEDLRDGTTPIELDFDLQRSSQPAAARLHGGRREGEAPLPGVTAIAPPPPPPRQRQAPAWLKSSAAASASGAASALRATRSGATHAAGAVANGASAGARAVASGGAAAGRAVAAAAGASAGAARAAASATAGAGVAVGRSVGRQLRLSVCKVGSGAGAAAAGVRAAGSRLRRVRLALPKRAPRPSATTATAAAAAAAAEEAPASSTPTVAAPVPVVELQPARPVLQFRSIPAAVSPPPADPPPVEPSAAAPFDAATATPVPALLTSSSSASSISPGRGARAPSRRRAHRGPASASQHGVVGRLLGAPAWLALGACRGVLGVGRYSAAAVLCAFFPRGCKLLGAAALLSGPTVPLLGVASPVPAGPLRLALAPLAPLRGPFAAFAVARVLGPLLAPAVWRNVMYWQRTLPIMARYVLTSKRAKRLQRAGRHEAAEEAWAQQHERGAGEIFDMLAELKGFYLKLGQILASKTDMLPQPYTESLSRLLDRLPPAPFASVRRTIRAELGAPPEALFRELDPFPLASATIAQVHKGSLLDGTPVVVKVQHGHARAMMRQDLANLAAMSRLMEAAGLQLGFDHGSLVREYNIQVPLEFDFLREARVATAVRSSLEAASASFPALRRVVVPAMVPSHSTPRLLTMEYLDGVPLLDIAGMDVVVRHGLMTSLILAYGVMILRDGLFHSDPHPGNVMALRRRRPAAANGLLQGGSGGSSRRGSEELPQWESGELQVALLDFGQAKQLTPASKARYALLVAAMAIRDDDLVLAVAGELGLIVENCSDAFAATAAYILFDTRMDFPEAHMGPMHPDAHEFRTAKVPSLPQDLFMIMRSVTLLRGLLSSLQVDVCAAQLWRPLALQVLADLTPVHRGPSTPPTAAAGSAEDLSAADLTAAFFGSGGGAVGPAEILASDLAAVEPLGIDGYGSPRVAVGGHLGYNHPVHPPLRFHPELGSQLPRVRAPQPGVPTSAVQGVSHGAVQGQGHGARDAHQFVLTPRAGTVIGVDRPPASPLARTVMAAAAASPSARDAKAAAAAAKRAEKEAEAARRQREREAAAAARKEEEARRRAEWEETQRRKAAEKEAKAARQRAAREAAEAKKLAEKAAREARKRAEIEAANLRRQADRMAAAGGYNPRRSMSVPPARPAPVSVRGAEMEVGGGGSGRGLPGGASPVGSGSSGVIHSPVPMRMGSSGLDGVATARPFGSRFGTPGASGPNSPGGLPGPSVSPAAAAPGNAAGGDVAAASSLYGGPGSALAASASGMRGGRTPSGRFAPLTPPRLSGDAAIAAAAADAQADVSDALPTADGVGRGASIPRPGSPYSPSGSASRGMGSGEWTAASTVPGNPAVGVSHRREDEMDELTARLVARADALAASADRVSGMAQNQVSRMASPPRSAAAAAGISPGPAGGLAPSARGGVPSASGLASPTAAPSLLHGPGGRSPEEREAARQAHLAHLARLEAQLEAHQALLKQQIAMQQQRQGQGKGQGVGQGQGQGQRATDTSLLAMTAAQGQGQGQLRAQLSAGRQPQWLQGSPPQSPPVSPPLGQGPGQGQALYASQVSQGSGRSQSAVGSSVGPASFGVRSPSGASSPIPHLPLPPAAGASSHTGPGLAASGPGLALGPGGLPQAGSSPAAVGAGSAGGGNQMLAGVQARAQVQAQAGPIAGPGVVPLPAASPGGSVPAAGEVDLVAQARALLDTTRKLIPPTSGPQPGPSGSPAASPSLSGPPAPSLGPVLPPGLGGEPKPASPTAGKSARSRQSSSLFLPPAIANARAAAAAAAASGNAAPGSGTASPSGPSISAAGLTAVQPGGGGAAQQPARTVSTEIEPDAAAKAASLSGASRQGLVAAGDAASAQLVARGGDGDSSMWLARQAGTPSASAEGVSPGTSASLAAQQPSAAQQAGFPSGGLTLEQQHLFLQQQAAAAAAAVAAGSAGGTGAGGYGLSGPSGSAQSGGMGGAGPMGMAAMGAGAYGGGLISPTSSGGTTGPANGAGGGSKPGSSTVTPRKGSGFEAFTKGLTKGLKKVVTNLASP